MYSVVLGQKERKSNIREDIIHGQNAKNEKHIFINFVIMLFISFSIINIVLIYNFINILKSI